MFIVRCGSKNSSRGPFGTGMDTAVTAVCGLPVGLCAPFPGCSSPSVDSRELDPGPEEGTLAAN